jgi:hypothetical protein
VKSILPRSCRAPDAHGERLNGYAERHRSAKDGSTVVSARRSTATDQSEWRHGGTPREPTGAAHTAGE